MTQEIVMILGIQASGKSTVSQQYIDRGYVHLNRDKNGGRVVDLLPLMEAALRDRKNIVLDNTFVNARSRAPFLEMARQHNVPVICKHINTSIEDAQLNAANRILDRHGKLLSPNELKASKDPNIFSPAVLFMYRKAFEPPKIEEGFASVETIAFTRKKNPDWTGRALLLDYDGTLRKTKSGADYPIASDDVEILPNRREVLQSFKDQGYILLGISNQSGVEKGKLSNGAAKACFEKTNELLGQTIDYSYCPHASFPIGCYCRKPLPGRWAEFQRKYLLDADQCLMVGDLKSDETFAERSGIKFIHAEEFFR